MKGVSGNEGVNNFHVSFESGDVNESTCVRERASPIKTTLQLSDSGLSKNHSENSAFSASSFCIWRPPRGPRFGLASGRFSASRARSARKRSNSGTTIVNHIVEVEMTSQWLSAIMTVWMTSSMPHSHSLLKYIYYVHLLRILLVSKVRKVGK